MNAIVCKCDRRREAVRAKKGLNGLDYIEVSPDQRTLTVYFLGKAPQHLTRHNFRISGGQRVRNIEIVRLETVRSPDPRLDDKVRITVDRPGDFSSYTLHIINVAEPIDPYYNHLAFTFKIDCPSDLDCAVGDICPPEVRTSPEINYLAKDYASLRQLILDRLALVMPEWQERHVPDIGITLVELLAYTGDYLSYFQDSVATEAYLDTSRRRISVRRHARLVDYRMHNGCNARAWLCLTVNGSVKLDPALIFFVAGLNVAQADRPVLSSDELRNLPASSFIGYEPLVARRSEAIELFEEHNEIQFYTFGQRRCCLPKGATSASLRDGWAGEKQKPAPAAQIPVSVSQETSNKGKARSEPARKLCLKPGDVLLFEEVRGPKTGESADADPNHRHFVKLTSVQPSTDPLDDTPILEIAWSPSDALPFPLCLSEISDAEHGCVYQDKVSVARGNVVFVDHGLTLQEGLGEVPFAIKEGECYCEGRKGEESHLPGRYRPKLANSPVTLCQTVDFEADASDMLPQDPTEAVPAVTLTSRRMEAGSIVVEEEWDPRLDLLESEGTDRHFVLEFDNEGIANIRFGDGDCGSIPDAGMGFSARYRVGNGRAGNVGAEAIRYLVYREEEPLGIEQIRNPLPAFGGVDPEASSEVKLLAPSAFRTELQRAITPEDYASIAERNSQVQRAGAVLCWNGSWYEVRAAIDPKGVEQASPALLKTINEALQPFRRIGHDVQVAGAEFVSLDVAMQVCVKREFLRGHVKAALLEVFSNRIQRNGNPGFFHPDSLSFGEGIFVSRLVAEAMKVEGVEGVRVTRLQRQFEKPDHEVENGVLPIGPLKIARCDNDANYPERGRFALEMQGGR